ncbi:putative glutathione S-transferase 6 [Aphelenchoides fujianensis]|nr:putative glutathione S-transferase 6 [Aphelenchoides fujianensis]
MRMFFSLFLVSLFVLFDLSITEHALLVDAVEAASGSGVSPSSIEELIPSTAVHSTASPSTHATSTGGEPTTAAPVQPIELAAETAASTAKSKGRHGKKHKGGKRHTGAPHKKSSSSSSPSPTAGTSELTTSPPPPAAHQLDASASTGPSDHTANTPAMDVVTSSAEHSEKHVGIAGHKFARLHKHKTTTAAPEEEQLTLEGGDEDGLAQGGSNSSSSAPSSSKGTTAKPKEDGDQPAVNSKETEIEISEPAVDSNKPHFKLIYFDARGICESIRLIFRYANQSFVDERISKKQWLAMKDSTFYGKLPILEVDGRPLAQCYTISRYLAKQFGLNGADDWSAAKIDEVADFHKGVHTEISPYIFVLSGYRRGDRDVLRKDVFIPKKFIINRISLYVSFIDDKQIQLFCVASAVVMEKFPMLSKFVSKVQSLPQIKDYIKSRSQTPLQVQF